METAQIERNGERRNALSPLESFLRSSDYRGSYLRTQRQHWRGSAGPVVLFAWEFGEQPPCAFKYNLSRDRRDTQHGERNAVCEREREAFCLNLTRATGRQWNPGGPPRQETPPPPPPWPSSAGPLSFSRQSRKAENFNSSPGPDNVPSSNWPSSGRSRNGIHV